MKKVCLIVITFLFLVNLSSSKAKAQEAPPNKIGINIAAHLERFDDAAKAVGPGGWVTIMPQSLSPEVLQPLFDAHPEVNIIIRTHYPATVPYPGEATSLAASLGSINTHGRKIFIMPWNEPNMARECGGIGNELNSSDTACAQMVVNYTNALFSELSSTGLLHNKIEILSPMINQSAPNFIAFVNALGGADYFKRFYGISMNLYNFQKGCLGNDPLCNPNPLLNPIKYRDVLKILGVEGMKVFGVETGIVDQDYQICPPNVTDCPIYDAAKMFNFLTQAYETWLKDPNFIMASPLAYNPEIWEHPMWLWGSVVEEFIKFLQDLSSHPIYGDLSEEILRLFEEWLKEKLRLGELVICPDGSYAPSLDLCGRRGIPGLSFTCNPSLGGNPDSRPIPCDACILEPPLTYSCASTFAVHNTVSWKWEDSDFICEPTGEHWVERAWGGDIIIDPSQVKVPFVGKKGEEDVEKYLADYFEGTAFYYGPDIDLSDCKKDNPNEAEYEACQEAVERVVAEGGVFRKLAPKEWQDELKEEMIERAQKSLAGNIQEGMEIIHDYLIEHGGISMSLSQINPPPKPPEDLENEAAYQNWVRAYDNWKESDSGKLWAAVPMFSREDSPGQVMASVNTKRKDNVSVMPPVQIEKVPHLARLFEVTRELQNLLLPQSEEESQASTQVLLASSNPQVLGEKTLLAQSETGPCVDSRGYVCTYDPSEGGCQWGWCASMEIQGICCSGKNCTVRTALADAGHMDIHINGTEIATQRPRGTYDWQIGSPGPNQRVCTNVAIINRDIGIPGGQYTESAGCCIDLDEDGVGCCEHLGPPINEPKCGLPEPMPYPACEYESITDDNPNDAICCDPIVIDLKAVEQFENPNYTGPCIWFTDPATGERDLLNPDCKKTETRHVHRDVKVDLFHPFLEEIWGQTTDSFSGLFNIFRPKIKAPFEDLDAHGYIEYSYGGGSITPEAPWKFYFPHLGGIQKAKEWVLETLNPKEK